LHIIRFLRPFSLYIKGSRKYNTTFFDKLQDFEEKTFKKVRNFSLKNIRDCAPEEKLKIPLTEKGKRGIILKRDFLRSVKRNGYEENFIYLRPHLAFTNGGVGGY
jgi:hypothetical protein